MTQAEQGPGTLTTAPLTPTRERSPSDGRGPATQAGGPARIRSVPWAAHGQIVIIGEPELPADIPWIARALIAEEAAKTDRLWELRPAVLRLAALYGCEAEIVADDDQDWHEPTQVILRPQPR